MNKSNVAREYITKFPDTPTTTLAKKAYKENPALWTNLEACRCCFRRVRGNQGKYHRNNTAKKEFYRPNDIPGFSFDEIPEGIEELGEFVPHEITAPGDYLVLADVHVPYHDKEALVLALEAVNDPAGIIILGDFVDHYSLSRWQNDPRRRNFAKELETSLTILGLIRKKFPNSSITYLRGNHEIRYRIYMEVKAPELLDVPCFQFEQIYQCDELGIDVVEEMHPLKLGKLSLIHGSEYRFSISNPVNPARGLFLRGKASGICAHFHQPSHHSENTLDDKHLTCWSVGCLCDLHPRYSPLNKWGHGFAIVNIDKDGAFSVDNNRIIDGKVWG